MRKLALSDEILLEIEKPARYIGNEINSVMKNKNEVDIRFAMCFPDVYEIGMSHLGIQILYDMFNRREDTWCERVYSPWPDLDAIMRKENIPLFALESQDNIKDFDFLGITIQYEMCYTNILQILDLSQIPLHASDRSEDDPIVMGGGPCAYNPEPLAKFFDIFYIGEGETVFDELLDEYKIWKNSGKSRKEFLEKAAEIPGLYIPAFYTTRMEHLQHFIQIMNMQKKRLINRSLWILTMSVIQRNLLCHLLRQLRTVLHWKSRGVVSGDAVFVRQV